MGPKPKIQCWQQKYSMGQKQKVHEEANAENTSRHMFEANGTPIEQYIYTPFFTLDIYMTYTLIRTMGIYPCLFGEGWATRIT